MAKIVLTKTKEKFIIKNYLTLSAKEIGEKLGGIPKGTITSFLRRNNLSIPRHIALEFKEKARKAMLSSIVHPEDELIKELYLLLPEKSLANLLGRSDTFIRYRMKKMNLSIPADIVHQNKLESYIKKGNVPQNKGKKQSEYMSAEAIARTAATRFKKGEPNHNSLYDGAITIRHPHKDRGAKPHYYIRLSKGIWKELQIHNWEKENGPVPKGYVLACKNGDTLNCKPSNWFLLTKADNARRNAPHDKLPDAYVAHLLAGHKNRHLKKDFLKMPELLDTKRQLLLLNKKVKNTDHGKK